MRLRRLRAFSAYKVNHQGQQCAADECTYYLEEHIEERILCTDASADPATQCDGGVDVASADVADGVSHGDDSHTESKSSTYYRSGIVTAVKTYSCAAAEKNEHHCAHHFC